MRDDRIHRIALMVVPGATADAAAGRRRAAAAMFTLIASARRHGLDPQAYLTDVFTRLPATPISQLHQFLPDQWQPPAD